MGSGEGKNEGGVEGKVEGFNVGRVDGLRVGITEGDCVGSKVGNDEGKGVGKRDGDTLGIFVGAYVGAVGVLVGEVVGEAEYEDASQIMGNHELHALSLHPAFPLSSAQFFEVPPLGYVLSQSRYAAVLPDCVHTHVPSDAASVKPIQYLVPVLMTFAIMKDSSADVSIVTSHPPKFEHPETALVQDTPNP